MYIQDSEMNFASPKNCYCQKFIEYFKSTFSLSYNICTTWEQKNFDIKSQSETAIHVIYFHSAFLHR